MAFAATPALAQPKDALTVDLPGDVATMDPQLQWDTDSYTVYRNIFDNLVTRDVSGKIVPQVATAWRYTDDTTIVFDLRTDIVFQDGSRLTPDDVVFSVRRITNPAFKSPQLSQFDQIASAEVTGPAQVTLHTKTPYPVLMAQLVKLSIVPKAYVEKIGDQKFNQEPIGSGPYRLRTWQRGVQSVLDASTVTGAASRPSAPSHSAPCRTAPPASPICAPVAPTSRAACRPTTPSRVKSDKSLQLAARRHRARRLPVHQHAGDADEGQARPPGDRHGDRPRHHHFRPATGIRQAGEHRAHAGELRVYRRCPRLARTTPHAPAR